MRNAESTFCFGSHLPQLVQQTAASKHGSSEEGDLLTFHKVVNINQDLHVSKHLKGRLGPPVSDVMFLDQWRSVVVSV